MAQDYSIQHEQGREIFPVHFNFTTSTFRGKEINLKFYIALTKISVYDILNIMTQHSSLRLKGVGTAHRSVLKRFERILKLQKEEKWKEGDPIFGLPKVKTIRLKIKKEKPAAAPEAAAGAVAEGTAGAVPVAPAKEAPSAEKASKTQAPAEKAKEAKTGKETKPGKEPRVGQESAKKPAEKK